MTLKFQLISLKFIMINYYNIKCYLNYFFYNLNLFNEINMWYYG